MAITFKDFLLLEKVQRNEFAILEKDPKFLVGIEFEYSDDNIGEYNRGMSDNELEEISNIYESFMNRVEDFQVEIEDRKLEWQEQMREVMAQAKMYYEMQLDELDEDDKDTAADYEDAMYELTNGIESNSNNLSIYTSYVKEADIEAVQEHEWVEKFDIKDHNIKKPTIPKELLDFWGRITDSSQTDVHDEIDDILNDAILHSNERFRTVIMPKKFPEPQAYAENFMSEVTSEIIEEHFDFDGFPFKNYEVGNYHEGTGTTNKWRIEPDVSIYPEGTGIEIISPIMKMVDSFAAMEKVFDYIADHGETNTSTGLHINMSYKGFKTKKLDVFKMMLFSEEGLIDKHFPGRSSTGYANFMRNKLSQTVHKGAEEIPKEIKSKISQLQPNTLNTIAAQEKSKFNAINISNIDIGKGRIEFRYIGGANYHEKINQIKIQILRFAHLIKLGMDLEYKKNEYLKKLAKFSLKSGIDDKRYLPKGEKHLYGSFDKKGIKYYLNSHDNLVYPTNNDGIDYMKPMSKESFEALVKKYPKFYKSLAKDIDAKTKNAAEKLSQVKKTIKVLTDNPISKGTYKLYAIGHDSVPYYTRDGSNFVIALNNNGSYFKDTGELKRRYAKSIFDSIVKKNPGDFKKV